MRKHPVGRVLQFHGVIALLASILGTGIADVSIAVAQPQSLIREEAGYRLEPGIVVAEDAAHWRAWEAGGGTRVVDTDGTVRPRFIRADIDAVTNAGEFINISGRDTTIGGVSGFGNAADSLTAPFVADGDLETWWEPDTEFVDDSWVEIDLGRTVIARRIHVRFADTGDPFLMFRVLVSDGTESFGRKRVLRYQRAGQIATPNKSQREFTFDLAPRRPVPDGVEGDPVQFVRIDLLATDGPRAEEVVETEYVRLAPEDQGAIDYFRVTVVGREIPVLRESYLQLPTEQQGPVRFYRRERPRLAEVQVESVGDNVIALTQRELQESGEFFDDLVLRFVTDGLLRTGISLREYDPFRDRDQLLIDLGARFWLDRIRLMSDLNPLTSYQIRLSDGTLNAEGDYLWTTFDERLNAERFLEVEESFSPRPVRLVELRRLNLLNDSRLAGKLNEIQAYGEGYVSDVLLTSPVIKFDGREMVTSVDWKGDTPVGTSLEIRTRSGDELIQIPHYLNLAGGEISGALWERLPAEQQGPIRVEEVPGPDWSPWSAPYLTEGQPFQSPSPRRLALIQVRLRTFQPLRTATIRRVTLELAPPLIDQAVAEVTPTRRVDPGLERDFRLYLRVDRKPDDPGFSAIRLQSSASAPIDVIGVSIGSDDELRFDQAEPLWPGPVEVRRLDGAVAFDLPDELDPSGRVMEFRVRTSVFLPSTTFALELVSNDGQRVQQVDVGDATSLVASNQLVVVAELEGLPLLAPLEIVSPIFSPNGDGIHDTADIVITVYQLSGRKPLQVRIHDLSGRSVRELSFTPPAPSGRHSLTWDGLDDSGRLVAPGIYLLRVDVPTDAGANGTSAVHALSVVY
jgi:hypothetical protein